MSEAASPDGRLAALPLDPRTAAKGSRRSASPWPAWAAVLGMEAVMLARFLPLLLHHQWGLAALTGVVMFSVLAPTAGRPWMPLQLPVGLEVAIAAFVFATLFLGEVADFYNRFSWWDMVLHGSSGVLFSVVGLPVAYALQRGHGEAELAPRVAFLFAVMFAMSIGTFWEIFEFALQNISGLPVQVPRLSDSSALPDTMGDLILNAVGAILVAAYGWHASRPGKQAGMPQWVGRFLRRNPGFFNRDRRPAKA